MVQLQVFRGESGLGLASDERTLLEPIYRSIQIFNNDPPELSLEHFSDDPSVIDIDEATYPIVIADGKQGLVTSSMDSEFQLGYDQIIKLTYCDFLCRIQTNWVLVTVNQPMAKVTTVNFDGALTLDSLFAQLLSESPDVLAGLQSRLRPSHQEDVWESEFRAYWGEEQIGTIFHSFVAGTTKVLITNDFQIMR